MSRIQRALISVYDKTGIAAFAQNLQQRGVEIISTGGTASKLEEHGIRTRAVSEITQFPEILGGRVKTLHPRIFGGLLALREDTSQKQQVQEHNIPLIDLVVVNLYPFEQTVAKPNIEMITALESIDIGGPSMIRAAAKNFLHVAVVTSPQQYAQVLHELDENDGQLSMATRTRFASAAFARTAEYDSAIHHYLSAQEDHAAAFSDTLSLMLTKVQDLRYGENPHQKAALFRANHGRVEGLLAARQLHGKELSYNNFLDTNAAVGIVQEFSEPCAVIVKHTNPCGVATHTVLSEAFINARATDPVSAFGGIVALNRPVDVPTATAISEAFTEVVIAPRFAADALRILTKKKNLRLLEMPDAAKTGAGEFEFKRVQGGVLVQDQDFININDIDFRVVTKRQPTREEWTALKFGWRVCKWVKSNAIVYCRSDRTVGIGAGQMSRVDSSRLAVDKAQGAGLTLTGTAMASDAFFPFRDGVDVAASVGTTAIVQPGGSVRDEEVIQAANEHNLTMVFTGIRHFRH